MSPRRCRDRGSVIFDAILNRRPPPARDVNRSLPPALDQTIARLLAKDAGARPQTAHEVMLDLQAQRRPASSRKSVPSEQGRSAASIVVLPFEDLSVDKSQQAFCEGMAA